MSENVQEFVYSADDPIWIDTVWLDTVVVAGLTCFILCLKGLAHVRMITTTKATTCKPILDMYVLPTPLRISHFVIGLHVQDGHALRNGRHDSPYGFVLG
jgi:hypothetical protein